MELFGILAIVLSAIAGVASTSLTNRQNKQNADEQLANQQNFSHNEAELANQRALQNYWETESPEARVKQLKDAGLSTGLMYGGSSAGGVSVTSQATTPSATLPIMQNPMSGLGDMFQQLKTLKESENIGESTEKIKEETNKIKSDIEMNNATIEQIATQNNLTNVMAANAKLDGVIKQVEVEVAQETKQNRIDIVKTQLDNMVKEGNKMLQEINGLKIDNENKQKIYNATINKMSAETSLLWKQVAKTEAETWLVKATTALTTEQTNLTFAQRQKALKEVSKIQDEIAKIDAEIKLIETQEEKIKWDKTTEIIGRISQIGETMGGVVRLMAK